jgi:tellurite resistance protein
MALFDLTPVQIRAALGAARSVAECDGAIEAHERELLAAAARALGQPDDVDAIEPVSAAEVAAVLPEPATRTRLVQALIILALMDGEIKDAELKTIRAYAAALGVDEPRIDTLKKVAAGHHRLAYLHEWRRSGLLKDAMKKAWEAKGFKGIWSMLVSMRGTMAQDPEIAWRYKRLGLLPEGTFGRAYWQHMTERGFAFPGEPNSFPEELANHDLSHVLGGYDTDPLGECQVVAFVSGFMKADPFGYLFQIFLHMQLGVHMFDGTPTQHMIIPTEKVLAALERGSRLTFDLYDPKWDFWADFPLPLEEVRKKYGVPSAS